MDCQAMWDFAFMTLLDPRTSLSCIHNKKKRLLVVLLIVKTLYLTAVMKYIILFLIPYFYYIFIISNYFSNFLILINFLIMEILHKNVPNNEVHETRNYWTKAKPFTICSFKPLKIKI